MSGRACRVDRPPARFSQAEEESATLYSNPEGGGVNVRCKLAATVRALLTVGIWGFRCKEPTVNSHDELTVML